VSRPTGSGPVVVPGHPVHAGPVPESCSGQGSGAAPVHAPGRLVPPGNSRKTHRKVPPLT
jgi:hypothetical protein